MTDPAQLRLHLELGATHWWLLETKQLAARVLERQLGRSGLVLDAGAGVTGLASLLEPPFRVVSADISEAAQTLAQRAGARRLVRATVEELPFRAGAFDAVVSLDVIYHRDVRDDRRAVREMATVLRSGGVLVINLPAYEWMRSSHDDPAGTARRYTRAGVARLLSEAGLTLVQTTYRNTLLFPLAVVRRKVLRHSGSDLERSNPAVNRVLRLVLQAEGLWLRRWSFPFGLSVFAVARKP
jgi:SAM-dependent methyltransferase